MTALQWPEPPAPESKPGTTTPDPAAAFLDGVAQWAYFKGHFLRRNSEAVLGPTTGGSYWHQFTVTVVPDGTCIVAADRYTDLDCIHDACQTITEACLNGNEEVEFTRDPHLAQARIEADEPDRHLMHLVSRYRLRSGL